MSIYDPRFLFEKEPVVIAGAIRSVLYVGVLMGALHMTIEQMAGIALALEVLLGLFARNASTPTANPSLPSGTVVTISDAPDKTKVV